MSKDQSRYLADLRDRIAQSFNFEELRSLAFDLGLDWEELQGSRKTARVQDLIVQLAQNDLLEKLIEMLRQRRPRQSWPAPPENINLPGSMRQGSKQNEVVTPKPLWERSWFQAIAAIVALAAGIAGFFADSGLRDWLFSEQPEPTTTATEIKSTTTPQSTETAIETPTPNLIPTIDPNIPSPNATLGDTWIRPTDGMVMIYVPTPTTPFALGSGAAPPSEGYWIDKYEVSNDQYQKCVDAGECEPSLYADDKRFNGANYPVVGISWFDAVTYSAWVGGKLPTEVEWEYAAVSNFRFDYPWGNEIGEIYLNFCDTNCEQSFREGNWDDGYQYTAPVDSFLDGESWVGTLNMAGNTWEWTMANRGDERVVLGGSWRDDLNSARAGFKNSYVPGLRSNKIGFRVVMSQP